ncbi:MAG: hypothetical protein JKY32_04050 [Rhizobiales bacterium]|nr:hypothetical protein [Hyphomicrobiales bacterium]
MLQQVLRANAASCALFGALFSVAAPAISIVIGDPPTLLLQFLGAGLLVNAALLFWASVLRHPNRAWILFFALGDAIWVAAILAFIGAGLWITTPSGIAWSLGVSAFVGACGVLQWRLAPKPV